MALKIGNSIPEFSLKDQHGNLFESKSLIGKTSSVIYFYPKNFTPGCTKEACEFRDRYEAFTDMNAKVIGISRDSTVSHRRFANQYNLPFTLLSDKNNEVGKMFGVKKSFLGLLPGRETYVFDKQGKLIFTFNSLDAKPHITKALQQLTQLNE
ncbi:MAG: peroxiredoxin [Bacteroidia bacterium]|nr:peroxiredoxin [Bacteroidia bacterium]NNF32248.1 peroxiredoxin [Flavobacteriaceae bacterium]MBT8276201.1 peroxiredoxin [Bacteroidia bacterium]NNJ83149.1 peroxiredoxin [Flavobacteriaceae bacterium]NNK54343.1 peroxiredoxin [Flavobacteriaceae bacterium]